MRFDIKDWIKKDLNYFWVIVLVLGILVRLYFFIKTHNQVVWWDEAEYMLLAKHWVFDTSSYGWFAGRPILLVLLAAPIFWLGLGEIGVRLIIFLMSIGNVILTYKLGKELYNKRIAIVSAFLFSTFHIDLFFANRLLAEVPSLFLGLLASYVFIKGYLEKKSTKLTILSGVLFMLAALMKFPAALFGLSVATYTLIITRLRVLKDKLIYKGVIACVLTSIPFVYYILSTGAITEIQAAGSSAASLPLKESFGVLLEIIKHFPKYLLPVYLGLFFVGLVTLINFVLSLGLKNKDKNFNGDLFCVLMIIINLIYFGFYVNHFEERYISYIFPFVFLITAKGIMYIYDTIEKTLNKTFLIKLSKYIGIGIIIVVMVIGGYAQVKESNKRISSFLGVHMLQKEAGLWLKANTQPGDKIFAADVPQFTYYSERYVSGPGTPENITKANAKYLAISIFEKFDLWVYEYPLKQPENLKMVQVYMWTEQNPAVIIYEIQN